MRKKRAWFLVLPVLLFGAVWWAQKARWNRIEEEFRKDVLSEPAFISLPSGSNPNVRRGLSMFVIDKRHRIGHFPQVKILNRASFEAILADVHLRKSTFDGGEDSGKYLEIAGTCGALRVTSNPPQIEIESEMNTDLGFSKYDKNILRGNHISSCQFDWGAKWSAYELTPESALVLKKRILAQYPQLVRVFQSRKQ